MDKDKVKDPSTYNDPRLTDDKLDGTEEQQNDRYRQLRARQQENTKYLAAK